jgi:hypothetical protein
MSWVENKAGNGGSGIVVIKYLNSSTLANEVDSVVNFSSTNHYGYTSIAGADAIQPSSGEAFTVAAWVRPATTCNTRCAIYSREGQMRLSIYAGKIAFILYNTNAWNSWTDLAVGDVPINQWSHVALTRNGTAIKVFLNGFQIASYTQTYAPLANNTSYTTYVGTIAGASEPFAGAIDEVKIWKTDRSGNIATDMNSSDELSSGLSAYWNFNEGSGSTSYNLAPGVMSETDLTISNSALWNSTLVSNVTTSGPYTVRTFYRTYLTGNDGWRSPASVQKLQYLVVAGGGAGGAAGGNDGSGGGGAGGVLTGTFSLSASIISVTVGAGGASSNSSASTHNPASFNGRNSTISGASLTTITSIGGGSGSSESSVTRTASDGGSGGGAGGYSGTRGLGTSGQGNNGGSASGPGDGGGGGAGAPGGNGNSSNGITPARAGGIGVLNDITGTNTYYGGGGGASGDARNGSTGGVGGLGGGGNGAAATSGSAPTNGAANTGGGGGGAAGTAPVGSVKATGAGGSGIIIIRWITATVPTFTKPTNAYLNVGMTETFTTNVAVDSATVGLTRTFRWESSTAGAGGPFSTIKTGTGAANAAFSWIPTDTSTSGSNYLYRVIVTDSDTAGLFIQDTSTAVFAVINRTLLMTGPTTIKKTINVTRNENYTISQGTPGYRYSLSPTIPGITLDTTTVGTTILKIADTATVGTFSQTLTVTDSVTGTVALPLTIVISAPPTLANAGEVVTTGQVFSIDSGNSASYTPGSTASGNSAIRDISGGKKTIAINGSALTYSDSFSGTLTMNTANSNYLNFSKDSRLTAWSLEAYVRLDSTLSAGSCVITNQYSGTDLNFALCLDSSRTFYTGFVVNGSWTYKRSSTILPVGSWFHLVGTFDPVNGIQLYLDGSTPVISENYTTGGLAAPLTGLDNVYIGRYLDVNYPAYLMPMTIGALRIYNRALTSAEVTQNMNATKARFQSAKVNKVKSTQKYGSLNVDSFTVSAGGDTKTVSFQVGNRTGITWDTSNAGVVNVSVLSSLPVGTYYDTVTVTDNLSASTYVPIKFTVTKADTITVTSITSPGRVTYNEALQSVASTHTISGLVNSETGTVTNTFLTTSDAQYSTNCATGGTCKVGDLAPGGGYVFHVSDTVIDLATGISDGGIYLATAPQTWNGGAVDPNAAWGCNTINISGTSSSVGSGAENTRLINAGCATAGIASRLAAASTFGGFSDWFIPSIDELTLIYNNLKAKSLSNLQSQNYWSSTQATGGNPTGQAKYWWFGSGPASLETDKNNSGPANMYVRPIRAFSPANLTTALDPINVGVYLVNPTLALSSPASLNNYQGISYTSSVLSIDQARQKPLSIGQYESYPNISSYPLNVYGGSGPGIITRTLVSAGSANCAIEGNFIIKAVNVGTCSVQAVKAGTRNYLPETATATILWITWSANNAVQSLGGNHSIPLTGGNQVIIRTETVTASAFSDTGGGAISSATRGTTIRINSTGFAGLTPAQITATFRPYEDGVVTAVTSTYVEVVIPVGATTGVIALDSPRGVAYTPSFTIGP